MLDFYLQAGKDPDFEIELETGEIIALPNLNTLSWENIIKIFNDIKGNDVSFLKTFLPPKVVKKFSYKQQVEIIKEWAVFSGVDWNELDAAIWLIKKYPREVDFTLRQQLKIRGITELLTYKPYEVLDIVIELIKIPETRLNTALGTNIYTDDARMIIILTKVLAAVNGNKNWKHPVEEQTDNNNEMNTDASDIERTQEELDAWIEHRRKLTNGNK